MKRLRLRFVWFVFSAVLCTTGLVAGCRSRPSSTAVYFPNTADVPGWSRASEPRTFSSEELFNYIDGDAERYLRAGVRSTTTIDYKFQSQIPVVVDLYTMSSPAAARAILDSEPTLDARSPVLGDAAHLFSQSLVFRKGRYLVRMVAYQEAPQLSQALLLLGRAMEQKLPR